MDEIGQILRDAREAKGLTQADVFEKIRITPKFLEAMEEGTYDVLPSQTHVRGYLRKYARHLQLEADPLLERYEALRVMRPKAAVMIKEITPAPQIPMLAGRTGNMAHFIATSMPIFHLPRQKQNRKRTGWAVSLFSPLSSLSACSLGGLPPYFWVKMPACFQLKGSQKAIQNVQGAEAAEVESFTTAETALAPQEEIDASDVATTTQLIVPTGRYHGIGRRCGRRGRGAS